MNKKSLLNERASREAMAIRYICFGVFFLLIPAFMIWCSFYPTFNRNLLMTALAFLVGGVIVFYIVFVRQKFEIGKNDNMVSTAAKILYWILIAVLLGIGSLFAAAKSHDMNLFWTGIGSLVGGIILFYIFIRNRKKIKIF